MATFETIVREITKLKSVTRSRSQDAIDAKLQIAAMARGLVDLPDSAVESGCAASALESPWFPSLAELRALCLAHRPALTASAAPRLARPCRTPEEIDARWWYKRALSWGQITRDRARELYPEMFYADGNQRPAMEVNFRTLRRDAHAKASQACRP